MALWVRVHYRCRNTKCRAEDSDLIQAGTPFVPTLDCYSCHGKGIMDVTRQDAPYESAGHREESVVLVEGADDAAKPSDS